MTRYALLLRGINVGRAKQVSMPALKGLLEAEGYTDVATLLRSGNVTLSASQSEDELGRSTSRAIASHFGFAVDVVVRSGAELGAVAEHRPFGDAADEGSQEAIAFFATEPTAAARALVTNLDPGEDLVAFRGRELYVWCPNKFTGSPVMIGLPKLKGLPVTTVRNRNTVRKLAALTA